MRWAGHAARIAERRVAHRDLVGRTDGRRPLGKPKHKWDNLTMDLKRSGMWRHGLDRAGSG